MGKQRKNRFPEGINGIGRSFESGLHAHPQTSKNDLGGNVFSATAFLNADCDMYSDTDPFGQYTGITRDGSMPLQDVDDL